MASVAGADVDDDVDDGEAGAGAEAGGKLVETGAGVVATAPVVGAGFGAGVAAAELGGGVSVSEAYCKRAPSDRTVDAFGPGAGNGWLSTGAVGAASGAAGGAPSSPSRLSLSVDGCDRVGAAAWPDSEVG